MQAVTEENEGNSHSGSMQAAGAAMAAAALLAACGGGDAPPAAMLDGRAAVSRPELLEVQGSDTRHALAAPTPDALMDWAERQFPHLFAPSASQRVADGLVYRFYSGTGNYLGVRDGWGLPRAGNLSMQASWATSSTRWCHKTAWTTTKTQRAFCTMRHSAPVTQTLQPCARRAMRVGWMTSSVCQWDSPNGIGW